MSYFPLFLDITDETCLVVGGGAVALRKVTALRQFQAKVCVIGISICEEIKKMNDVCCYEREYETNDLNGITLVIAATNNKLLNIRIAKEAKERKIPVNVVNSPKEGTMIFPSYVKSNRVVAAFSSGGDSPVITQYLKQKIEPFLTDSLGELSVYMGTIRDIVKKEIAVEKERKKVYLELLNIGVLEQRIPTKEEFNKIIKKFKK